uniref:Uncharacterized protein n=1 Tax=Brassica oleracea TaxID=3712 RepID=A0A3P6G728_BRAOL|nr:unnamed protein product [Brassica oleracea]
MKKLFQISSPIIATFIIIVIGLMANETYGNKNCTEILNTKEHTIPGGYVSHSAPCSGSSCVYLCKRKNANGVGTCIGPKKQEKCRCVYKCL